MCLYSVSYIVIVVHTVLYCCMSAVYNSFHFVKISISLDGNASKLLQLLALLVIKIAVSFWCPGHFY
jgi:hypothetical protein